MVLISKFEFFGPTIIDIYLEYDTVWSEFLSNLFQILPLNRENLPQLRHDFPQEMCDLILASDIFVVEPSIIRVSDIVSPSLSLSLLQLPLNIYEVWLKFMKDV